MDGVAGNLAAVRAEISAACARSGRVTDEVRLIAVSKTFPVDSVREAVEAGQRDFGESRLQEAEPKIAASPGQLHWHFIGRLQRNKIRRVLRNFDVIHSVDSSALAVAIDATAGELGLFPKVFLQVNIGHEDSKGGFTSPGLREAMNGLLNLKRLEMIGLMGIPPPGRDAEDARQWFTGLRNFRDSLEEEFMTKLPGLSMGMSGDFGVAIEEGATHVRVGSAIFGKRAYRVDGELG